MLDRMFSMIKIMLSINDDIGTSNIMLSVNIIKLHINGMLLNELKTYTE